MSFSCVRHTRAARPLNANANQSRSRVISGPWSAAQARATPLHPAEAIPGDTVQEGSTPLEILPSPSLGRIVVESSA